MKLFVLILGLVTNLGFAKTTPNELSAASKKCTECHKKISPGVVEMWGTSKHFRGNVGCFECHKAEATDKDQFMHHGERISTIVSPKDCGKCHDKEVKEFSESHHAQAAKILGSLDNTLAEVVEGNRGFKTPAFPHGNSSAAVNGCWQCHGSEVKVLKDGNLDPATWPNSGIGRLNPDGSRGSCAACHSRHKFSVAQARNPENCGKCHMGPDHPQLEIYNESKHGIAFRANIDKMNMENPKWIPGEDYNAAPTCATCHMSATKTQGITHDVGLRISWNNRPAVSVRPEIADKKLDLPGQYVLWPKRRQNMQNVCQSCHNQGFVENFYIQYDSLIDLYNTKFAKPGLDLMAAAKPLLNPVEFTNKIDFTWYEIWHHEGRRARHGAAMMGPDYTHWHGTYEVAKHFYSEFIPELKEASEKAKHSGDKAKIEKAKLLDAELDKVLNHPDHMWYLGKMTKEEQELRKKQNEEFKKRYK